MRFFFNDPATTEIYTLSLHDALPISIHAGVPAHGRADERAVCVGGQAGVQGRERREGPRRGRPRGAGDAALDRKSTRLNSSHGYISYAVFCLKKKKNSRSMSISI